MDNIHFYHPLTIIYPLYTILFLLTIDIFIIEIQGLCPLLFLFCFIVEQIGITISQ